MNHRKALGFVLACCALPMTLLAQPVLKVADGTSLDFGTIYRGDQIERKLTLKNTGTDTLVLGSVEPSCGCTGTVVSESRIPPGGAGSLLIKFNSRNFTGQVHKTVTVNSNSAEAARTVIEFVANIVDEIILSPTQLWFKEAKVGKQSSLTATVKNAGTDTLKLTGFRTSLKDFSLNLTSASIPPGGTFELVATLTPTQATAILADRVMLETNNPRQPDVAIPVYGNVKP